MEALAYGKTWMAGERNIVSHSTIVGSGDALQVNGSVYFTDSLIVGDGDTILGRGPGRRVSVVQKRLGLTRAVEVNLTAASRRARMARQAVRAG